MKQKKEPAPGTIYYAVGNVGSRMTATKNIFSFGIRKIGDDGKEDYVVTVLARNAFWGKQGILEALKKVERETK